MSQQQRRALLLLLPLLLASGSPGTGAPPSHVKFLSMFNEGANLGALQQQAQFANLVFDSNLTALHKLWSQYNLTGFLSIQRTAGVWTKYPGYNATSVTKSGLQEGWEQNLSRVLDAAEPYLRDGSLLGIFLGDELCCGGVPFENYTAVAQAVKKRLQSTGGLVYSNECATLQASGLPGGMPTIPDAIDLISVDVYGYGPGGRMVAGGPTEHAYARKLVEAALYPRMKPHQRVLLVPGAFAQWNVSEPSTTGASGSKPSVAQQDDVISKLDGYWSWAQNDTRIAGINCCERLHALLPHPQSHPPP